MILRFSYKRGMFQEALVSQISRGRFELNVNIIFGNIELIGGNPIGGLVSIVQGDAEQIDAAIEYLKDKNVGVEVISMAEFLNKIIPECHGEDRYFLGKLS